MLQPALRAAGGLGDGRYAGWPRARPARPRRYIDPRNVRRVVRALEVTLVTGRPSPSYSAKRRHGGRIFGLTAGEALYARIDDRVEAMPSHRAARRVRRLRAARSGRLAGDEWVGLPAAIASRTWRVRMTLKPSGASSSSVPGGPATGDVVSAAMIGIHWFELGGASENPWRRWRIYRWGG